MNLVHNWRDAWRWVSMQSMSIAIAIQATWALLSDDMRLLVPHKMVAWGTVAFLVTGIIGRLVKQDKPNDCNCK